MDHRTIPDTLELVKNAIERIPLTSSRSNQHTVQVLPNPIPSEVPWKTSLPESGTPLEESLNHLTTSVLPYLNGSSLVPRYFGFVTGGVTPAALAGDVLASVYDQNVQVHIPGHSICTDVEVAALNMLVDLFDLPRADWEVGATGNGGGTFTTGATGSNILGLALGREYVLEQAALRATGTKMSVGKEGLLEVSRAAGIDHIKVLSTLPHSSVVKACGVVGLGRNSIVSVGVQNENDNNVSIDINKLKSLAECAGMDRTAYILAISAGEVNTGHFATHNLSTMQALRDICSRHGIWIHVDGAFGLFARLLRSSATPEKYTQLVNAVQGLELVDSITADGHKLLNVPYDCGIFFTRHKHLSEQVFSNGGAAYLSSGPSMIQSPLNIGLENSRRFRALPVYQTLVTYGKSGYLDMLERQVGLTRDIARWVAGQKGYELLPGSEKGSLEEVLAKTFIIVLLRARDEKVNEILVQRINKQNRIFVSGTSWDGRKAVRIAVSNWRVDVERELKVVQEVLEEALK